MRNCWGDISGITVHKQPMTGKYDSNFWLCTIMLDPLLRIVGQENAYKEIVKTAVGGGCWCNSCSGLSND